MFDISIIDPRVFFEFTETAEEPSLFYPNVHLVRGLVDRQEADLLQYSQTLGDLAGISSWNRWDVHHLPTYSIVVDPPSYHGK
jgi:hypothetical protein